MDRVLLDSLVAESGNWSAVVRLLQDSDGSGPSALECVARVIYLPSTSPSTLRSTLGSSASKSAVRSAHLSYEIAYEMGVALGCKAAQGVVAQVLDFLSEVRLHLFTVAADYSIHFTCLCEVRLNSTQHETHP
jgi:hypothetical protein